MEKIAFQSYFDYIHFAKECVCGKVYPLSIAEGYQQGDIFVKSGVDCNTVLFWHYSGFAFIAGAYDESFLGAVYEQFIEKNTDNRRFVLFSDGKCIADYFCRKANTDTERRYFFEYRNENRDIHYKVPHHYELREIDVELLSKMEGRITPYFSWDCSEAFLEKGKGYCLISGDDIAAWAFSAAVSDGEIDIGVEVCEKYRHRGLATVVAKAMIQYILSANKVPVWACHCQNIASAALAGKLGFIKTGECSVIKRREPQHD
ncbi:MAG: GNAT family N-acetyltransferase [Lachnospiraceae bacterium]|nr:GNAT family N-acetyltransferase [Lachnospiraceae bacterium]